MNRARSFTHHWRRTAALACLALACVMVNLPSRADYTPETTPRMGEQRLNRFQFFCTHNSYERVDSIKDQMDLYDVWLVELDLRWSTDINDFWIFHDCAESTGNDSLESFLNQIDSSDRSVNGFTFVYFDDGDIGPCLIYPSITTKPSGWPTLLENKLVARWGNRVYTFNDFNSIDHKKWPSVQELRRRGKNFAPILNQNQLSYFFAMNSPGTGAENVFLLNTSDEDTPLNISDLGDNYLARHYPNSGWVCTSVAGYDGWQWAVDNNYTFPASNCSDMTSDIPRYNQLHPPLKTYVNYSGAGSVTGRGTYSDPYTGPSSSTFATAMARIYNHQNIKGSSMIELSLQNGTYTSPIRRIIGTMRLTPRGGNVRIQ